ncbi:2547_t:CDS:2 [Entrophospora sp. SA101]|nr:2547_t:CDS:2 [Entrophospora sp. SA101]
MILSKDLLLSHDVYFDPKKSKRSNAIGERDHQEFEKHAYIRQDAVDFLLPLSERYTSWVKDLCNNDDIYNDTPTRLIHMSPNEAVKRALKGEKIIADPAVKHRRPIGFDEPRLTYKDSVLYLLEPGELEFGNRRITDMNWSPKIFCIKESLIQKNQPVLYWLMDENGDGPERSFVREQLMVVALFCPAVKHRRPIGFDEPRLTYKDSVLYLLEPGELEFGNRRITDMNWSPKIFCIKESLIQKNQPVLYWLMDENGDGPERSFVREQLMVVRNVEYPPKWILRD